MALPHPTIRPEDPTIAIAKDGSRYHIVVNDIAHMAFSYYVFETEPDATFEDVAYNCSTAPLTGGEEVDVTVVMTSSKEDLLTLLCGHAQSINEPWTASIVDNEGFKTLRKTAAGKYNISRFEQAHALAESGNDVKIKAFKIDQRRKVKSELCINCINTGMNRLLVDICDVFERAGLTVRTLVKERLINGSHCWKSSQVFEYAPAIYEALIKIDEFCGAAINTEGGAASDVFKDSHILMYLIKTNMNYSLVGVNQTYRQAMIAGEYDYYDNE